MVAGTAQESPKRFRTLAKILYHLRSSCTIRTFVWLLFLYVTCSHHLNPRFWSGGFLLNDSTEPSIYKLSSRVPRFFLPGHGRIFLLIVRIRTVYAVPLPAFFHFFEKSCLFHLNLFFHKNSSFLIFYLVDCFCYTMNRVEEQAFFPVFLQFISYL